MHTIRTLSTFTLAIAFAFGAAVATGVIVGLSSPAQAVLPQGGQQQPGQQHGGKYKVVAFDGKNAQQLQQLLTQEGAQGWRLAQMSGSLVVFQR